MTQREIIGKTPKISKLAIALAIAGLMIAGGFVALASSQPTATSPTANAAATGQSILPDPTLNTNITWSTFYNGWNPLEYANGSANLTLNTGLSQYYANPITINPAGIQSKTLNGKYAGENFFSPANYVLRGTGQSQVSIGNTSDSIYMKGNATSTVSLSASETIQIPWAQMPSQNTAFDYITATLSLSAGAGATTYAALTIGNQTAAGVFVKEVYSTLHATAGKTIYLSESIAQLIASTGMQVNSTTNSYIYIGFRLYQAAGTAADTPIATLTMNNFAITTYPIILGQNSTGATVANGAGTIALRTFKPTTPMTLQNGSYTVAVSQTLQNTIISQTAINQNGYSEQVSYQGTEYLPTAPYLTYTASNISMPMNVSGSQFTIANVNGVSYLSAIQAKHNGTFLFALVNPNQQNSVILQVDYTTAQWNSVSGAPPFFSLAGLEYYWWVGLIGFFSLIGLGSAALAHWGGEEENLRTPKGKFGR